MCLPLSPDGKKVLDIYAPFFIAAGISNWQIMLKII